VCGLTITKEVNYTETIPHLGVELGENIPAQERCFNSEACVRCLNLHSPVDYLLELVVVFSFHHLCVKCLTLESSDSYVQKGQILVPELRGRFKMV